MINNELYDITGMTCSACSSRVEKGIAKLEGVSEISVNLLKNNMSVTYDESMLDSADILQKVEKLGYGAFLHKQEKKQAATQPVDHAELEMKAMKKRLIVSMIFTVPLFYIAMGEMAGWPLPGFLKGMENAMIYAFTQFLL